MLNYGYHGIKIEKLTKVYDSDGSGEAKVTALRGINLTIDPGEFVAVMGASGSGKSTLMNILGCLDVPTSGTYILDGLDVLEMSKNELSTIRNRKIGFVFQGFNLLSRTTAIENVELPLLYSRRQLTSFQIKKAATDSLEKVGLKDRFYHHPNQLSGGQQQRVAIARALINSPALILADEPTGNLDTATSMEIMAIFQELNDAGISIVLVTHEHDIAHFARRIVEFKDGHIIQDGTIRQKRISLESIRELRSAEAFI